VVYKSLFIYNEGNHRLYMVFIRARRMQLYQERVMDHYRNPRNRGELATPDFSSDLHNPSCGDSIVIQATIKDGILANIAFEGNGCVISQAAASLLTEAIKEKSLDEIRSFTPDHLIALLGIPLGPTRLKCALLALDALKAGIARYA